MKNVAPISLVIPSYNRADLLQKTIESALDQSVEFAEIIVVDDASTDNTIASLKRYHGKIKVLQSEKIGVQRARNKGVAVAAAEYVAMCDSDDLLLPNYVESIYKWLSVNPCCDALYCNFKNFSDTFIDVDKFSKAPAGFFDGATVDGNFLSEIPDLYRKTIGFQPLFTSGTVFKKSFYQLLGGYDSAFNNVGAEDWEFTLRVIAEGHVSVCKEPLVLVRRHASNDSNNALRMKMGEIKILEYALKYHPAASNCADVIHDSLNDRRIDAFESAFASRNLKTAAFVFADIQRRPDRMKFRIKTFLVLLYAHFFGLKKAVIPPSTTIQK